MITRESVSKGWIESVSKSKKSDKILVEKVIRALMLLEGLAESSLDFVFKGGTALMLLFRSTKRLSIDIDIIVPEKEMDLDEILDKICTGKGFLRYEKQTRNTQTSIEKEHYKFFFTSALNNQESSILLDVLREEVHYTQMNLMAVSGDFIKETGETRMVNVPDFNNILGDKLTAFAPNTTGIPYRRGEKEMGMEIIKQMYDIGCIFDMAENLNVISTVFSSFAETELQYRDNTKTAANVLDDIIETSLAICLRKNTGNADFDILSRGIIQVKSFIFSDIFHLEKAITYAAKAAYMAMLVKSGASEIKRFDPTIDMKAWTIKEPMDTKLMKLKKTNPEAFFYLYQMAEIIGNVEMMTRE